LCCKESPFQCYNTPLMVQWGQMKAIIAGFVLFYRQANRIA
jgi:hypothetical protein